MKDTDYAFCVARIRANEKHLLTLSDINKLIECNDFDSAVKVLSSKGWIDSEGEIGDYIASQNKKLWKLLSESVPDKKELDVLCMLNDFFNIKAAVKCLLTSNDFHKYYVYPTTVDLDQLTKSVKNLKFDKIDGIKGESAQKAYEVANKTENGQNAEIILDKALIDCMSDYAKKNSDKLAGAIYSFVCDTTNVKIALRCAHTKKNKDFVESAIGNCVNIDTASLIKNTLKGKEELTEFLLKGLYSEGVALYEENPSAYDKWCDDQVIKMAKKAKFTAFGFDPVCAYYYAKMNEIKTVNIVLSGLLYSADKNIIRQRVRELYV